MSKRALLIGINYKNTPNQLNGCINDMIQWYELLQDVYGFEEKDIVFLRDDKSDFLPTKRRILEEFDKLMKSNSDYIFVGYSGHGTSVSDNNNEEVDKSDECLVPSDVYSSGIIRDDELNVLMKDNTSTGLMVFDCCRSGSVVDLHYENFGNTIKNTSNIALKNKVICFSGCQDNQDAAEVFNLTNMLPQGALTIVLIQTLRRLKFYPKMGELFNTVSSIISSVGLPQKPNLSSSYIVDANTEFPFKKLTQEFDSNLLSENEALKNENRLLKFANEEFNNQLNKLKIQISTLNIQISSLNTQLLQRNNELSQGNTRINQLSNEIRALALIRLQNTQLNNQIAQLRTQNTQLNSQIAQLRTQNAQLTSQLTKIKK